MPHPCLLVVHLPSTVHCLVTSFVCLGTSIAWTYIELIFFSWRCDPTRVMASSFLMFLDHTQRPTTYGRTPLDEWSARRRDLYLTTQNTHNRQLSMPPVGIHIRINNKQPFYGTSSEFPTEKRCHSAAQASPFRGTVMYITVFKLPLLTAERAR